MAPNVLKFATSFGGSMVFDNRSDIGRYGMGMKAAALSMCPVLDLYSWQEPGAYYNMTLDVEAIGKERSNLIELPDPTLMDLLPSKVFEHSDKNHSLSRIEARRYCCRQIPKICKISLGSRARLSIYPAATGLASQKHGLCANTPSRKCPASIAGSWQRTQSSTLTIAWWNLSTQLTPWLPPGIQKSPRSR